MARGVRKWLSVVVTAVAVAAGLTASADSAQASCSYPSYSPSTVNMGLSAGVATYNVLADCDGGLASWSVSIEDLFVFAYEGSPQETFSPSDYSDSDAGPHTVELTTDDENYNENEFLDTFYLKRYDTWGNTFNAGPEPVRKGATIRFSGQLLRANWDQHKYYGYGNGYAHLDFRRAGNPTWRTVKTFRTSTTSPGRISGLSVKAGVSGFWRVYYTGNDYGSAALSKTDYVQVT